MLCYTYLWTAATQCISFC